MCLCAALLWPAAGSGQSAKDTTAVQNVISSLPLNQLKGISLYSANTEVTSNVPLGKFESSSTSFMLATPPPPPKGKSRKLPRFGVQFTSGTLGFGAQDAPAVLHFANVRVVLNSFIYNFLHFGKDRPSYTVLLQ